jgi:hypothetical protein
MKKRRRKNENDLGQKSGLANIFKPRHLKKYSPSPMTSAAFTLDMHFLVNEMDDSTLNFA